MSLDIDYCWYCGDVLRTDNETDMCDKCMGYYQFHKNLIDKYDLPKAMLKLLMKKHGCCE